MSLAPFKAVLDANVLYPFTLRDSLLRAAAAGFYQVCWSKQILDEATRNLVEDRKMTLQQAERLRDAMTAAFPEAAVFEYEGLIPAMRNQQKDRHVAAVAVKAGAQVIVTANLSDFRELPEGVEAQSTDEFLCNLLELDPDGMEGIVRAQAADLQNPPRSFDEVLRALQKVVPTFISELRLHVARGGA